MVLDEAAARAALEPLARRLGLGVEEAAAGIVRLADEHMAQALRVISVQRGVDPRDFTLVSFGGAGGLHVCALAEALGMRRALVPVHGGVLSALGMLVSPPGRELSQTFKGLLADLDRGDLEGAYAALEADGRRALAAEGVGGLEVVRTADLRYRGQSYTLTVPWAGVSAAEEAFHAAHERRFGHVLEEPVELVNVRVGVRAPVQGPRLRQPPAPGHAEGSPKSVRLFGIEAPVRLYSRDALVPGQRLSGPALVVETVATTFIAPGWSAQVEGNGSLVLARGAG